MHAPSPLSIDIPAPHGSGAVEEALVLWRALAGLGLQHVLIAPGSRSAPLVYALSAPDLAERITAHVRIDERAAAFTALGISRFDPAHPAAVITTSGTATAHLLAAVMEAHHSRIPLLVITADRPAELRGTGANQTTDQTTLYEPFVRYRADLPAPTSERATRTELRTLASAVARAWAAATGEDPGPVHLNLGLRDPLVPAGPVTAAADEDAEPLTVARRVPAPAPAPVEIRTSPDAVVIAGDDAGEQAAAFAEAAVLPLLAEPSSGARASSSLVTGYPGLLRRLMADAAHPLRPDQAIVFGHPTLSRPVLRDLLGADDVEVIVVDRCPRWNDAAGRAALVVPAAAPIALEDQERSRRKDRIHSWQDQARLLAEQAAMPWQTRAALAVWEASGPGDLLVLGSSSLVRDLEAHAGPTAARVIANRGLAGIDGTTAMAGGLALAAQAAVDATGDTGASTASAAPGRVRALVGDLTALHDLTGLLIGPLEQRPHLDLIVVDDDGGRIFSGLEHAAAPPDLLRRFFTTPHGADIAVAAQALGAETLTVTAEELPALLEADEEPGASLRVLVVQETGSDHPGRSRHGGVH